MWATNSIVVFFTIYISYNEQIINLDEWSENIVEVEFTFHIMNRL